MKPATHQAKPQHNQSLRKQTQAVGIQHRNTSAPLQRSLGNRGVQHLRQNRIRVGPPNDAYEQEADKIAKTVTRSSTPFRPQIRRRPEHNTRHNTSPLPAQAQSQIDSLRGYGMPLPKRDREFMESRFAHDFSNVRIHTGINAAETAAKIGARAFTLGNNVVFGKNQFRPGTAAGRRLLAHELTHVVQQQGSVNGPIQAEFAIAPLQPLPPGSESMLDAAAVQRAIAANTLQDEASIAQLRDILGIPPEPAVVDERFVQAVARYQHQFELAISGIIDAPTRRQLSREMVAEAHTLERLDTEFSPIIEDSLSAFGLEQDDFGFNQRGRFRGSRSLNPTQIRNIRTSLATDRTRNQIQQNIDILQSVDDRFSAVALDLPFIITLGVRESGVRTLLSTRTNRINTAGRDTHPDGRSGMDFFHRLRRGFTRRRQDIAPVTSGFQPGREDREPSLIQNRRLLLAFMIKTAADELSLRGLVRTELTSLLGDAAQATSTTDRLLDSLSIDALRSWKALIFAGIGYGQRTVQAILRAQHAANQPFSLERIMSIDNVARVGAARLDRARAVALGALVIERDLLTR